MKEIEVRFAKVEDAEGILKAHYSAVHSTASYDYSSEIITAWSSSVTPDRIKQYLENSFPLETTLVALVKGEIAGFGAIVESINELLAVYVASEFGGTGVGSALLAELEMVAKKRGCRELNMHSSLTAERFYRKHGYEEVERGVHTLPAGQKMKCVKMKKSLK